MTKSKNIAILFLIILVGSSLFSQSKENVHTIGLKYMFMDYLTPYDGVYGDFKNLNSGLEISYNRYLNENWSLNFPFRASVINTYDSELTSNTIGLDVQAHYNLLKTKHVFNPYLLIGAGGLYEFNNGISAQIPVGGGIDLKISELISLNLQFEARLSTAEKRNNFQTGLGFKVTLGKSTKDTDGDGVPDHLDACPDIPGDASAMGCPDRDGDGIPDHLDACPDIFGDESALGCPDRDGDGIADFEDRFPDDKDNQGFTIEEAKEEKVVSNNTSDPLLDSDGDGVPDVDDKCPYEPGPIWNRGCPDIKEEDKKILQDAMREVQFDINKSTIRPESYRILDQVIDLMKRYKEYILVINGHTDNTGSVALNQKLSEERAKSCYEYIKKAGISPQRMSYRGFGPARPLYSNDTETGRALNRRVEFRMLVN